MVGLTGGAPMDMAYVPDVPSGDVGGDSRADLGVTPARDVGTGEAG